MLNVEDPMAGCILFDCSACVAPQTMRGKYAKERAAEFLDAQNIFCVPCPTCGSLAKLDVLKGHWKVQTVVVHADGKDPQIQNEPTMFFIPGIEGT